MTRKTYKKTHIMSKEKGQTIPYAISIESTVKLDQSGFSMKIRAFVSKTLFVLDSLLTSKKICNTCLTD